MKIFLFCFLIYLPLFYCQGYDTIEGKIKLFYDKKEYGIRDWPFKKCDASEKEPTLTYSNLFGVHCPKFWRCKKSYCEPKLPELWTFTLENIDEKNDSLNVRISNQLGSYDICLPNQEKERFVIGEEVRLFPKVENTDSNLLYFPRIDDEIFVSEPGDNSNKKVFISL